MEASGRILNQISYLKDSLDQVNSDIETCIQITREIESEMVRCNEMEIELAETESELMKACYTTEFEVNGLATLSSIDLFLSNAAFLKASVKSVEEALCHQRNKQNEVVAKIDSKRDGFILSCHDFQWKIQADQTIMALSSQKESLEYEYELLIRKENALSLLMSAFVEDVLEELRSSLSVLEIEVQSMEDENKKILKDIDDLKGVDNYIRFVSGAKMKCNRMVTQLANAKKANEGM